MNNSDTRAKAHKIISDAVNAVFITQDGHGFPHPRTMWTAGIDKDFTSYFLTGRDLLKSKQIMSDPNVCVFWTLTDGSRIGWDYAFIKGQAQITDDQELRDRFWVDALTEYFPAGKEDPNYVVIVIKPRELMLMDGHHYPLEKIEF